jgi:hypothetical protein
MLISQRVLTTKPLEDRNLEGCNLCLHMFSSQAHIIQGNYFEIAVILYTIFSKHYFLNGNHKLK